VPSFGHATGGLKASSAHKRRASYNTLNKPHQLPELAVTVSTAGANTDTDAATTTAVTVAPVGTTTDGAGTATIAATTVAATVEPV